MTKDIAIIVLGFFVALVPFLGFPGSWKTVLFVLSGLSIALLMFLFRKDVLGVGSKFDHHKGQKNDVFVENEARGKRIKYNASSTENTPETTHAANNESR